MRLTIDTSGKRFLVTKAPEAKTDQHSEQRIDKATGLPMWTTQLACIDDQGGDVISVTTVGDKPDLRVDTDVELHFLEAIPWATNGRSGVAYRARAILPLQG